LKLKTNYATLGRPFTGADMTFPRAAFSLQRLESRQHLAAAVQDVDVGGLPREVVGIGDDVYFARDTGVDSYLRYSDVVRLNVKTGQQTPILRPDGSHFGQSQFWLASDGRRCFITLEKEVWMVAADQDRAVRLAQLQADETRPFSFVAFGNRTFFSTRKRIFSTDGSNAAATSLRASTPAPFELEVPVILGRRLYTWVSVPEQGWRLHEVGRTSLQPLDIPGGRNFTGFSGTFDIGGKLVVNAQNTRRRWNFLETNGTAEGTKPLNLPSVFNRVSIENVKQADAGRVFVQIRRPSDISDVLLLTDGTEAGTVQVDRPFDLSQAEIKPAGSDFLISTASATPDTDPESRQGDTSPIRWFDPFFVYLGPTDTVFRLNGSTGRTTPLLKDVNVHRLMIGADGSAYASVRLFGPLSQGFNSTDDFFVYRLTRPGDSAEAMPERLGMVSSMNMELTSIGPVTIPSFVSTSLQFARPAGQTVTITAMGRARVPTPEGKAWRTRFEPADGTLFLDLDDDGVFDANERLNKTETADQFVATDVQPGRYRVRLINATGYTMQGKPVYVTVTAAGPASASFYAVPDDGAIYGRLWARPVIPSGEDYTYFTQTAIRNEGVFFDINRNGQLDPGEPETSTDRTGRFRLKSVPALIDADVLLTSSARYRRMGEQGPRTVQRSVGTGPGAAREIIGGLAIQFRSVRGTVQFVRFRDDNGNGIYDAATESVLEGQGEIALSSPDFVPWRYRPYLPLKQDSQVTGLASGRYDVELYDYRGDLSPTQINVVFGVDQTVYLPIRPWTGIVRGRVVYDVNANDAVDDTDWPAPTAQVSCTRNGVQVASVAVEADGSFVLRRLPSGPLQFHMREDRSDSYSASADRNLNLSYADRRRSNFLTTRRPWRQTPFKVYTSSTWQPRNKLGTIDAPILRNATLLINQRGLDAKYRTTISTDSRGMLDLNSLPNYEILFLGFKNVIRGSESAPVFSSARIESDGAGGQYLLLY
jgi:hypothetical protein